MAAKRIIEWVVASIFLFILLNGASYFVRSDGYGLPGVRDGIVRVGCPFLILERGGFAQREWVSLSAAAKNLFFASLIAAFAVGIHHYIRRSADFNDNAQEQ